MDSLKQTEPFKADCAKWSGFQPCIVQKRTGQRDCSNCLEYQPESARIEIEPSLYTSDILQTAKAVGIVEMGGLGSILRTTAISHALREQNGGVNIIWFTHHQGAELLKYVPGVNAIDVEDTPFDEYKDIVPGLDALLNFESNTAAKSIVSLNTRIGGFALNVQNKLYGLPPHGDYMQRLQIDDAFRVKNTLTMQQVLLRTIGLNETQPTYDIELQQSNHQQAKAMLEATFGVQLPPKIIGLNIGTSEKGKLKRWPAEYYVRLAEQLAGAYPDSGVVILSGPDDRVPRLSIMSHMRGDLHNLKVLPGDMEVGTFIALVDKLELLVTSDTFAFHAAKSQNTKTIVLAGPMPHQELEVVAGDTVIGPNLYCAPCYNNCIQPVLGACMYNISVEEVFAKTTATLAYIS